MSRGSQGVKEDVNLVNFDESMNDKYWKRLRVRAVPLSREGGMRTGEMRSYATDEKTEVMAHLLSNS